MQNICFWQTRLWSLESVDLLDAHDEDGLSMVTTKEPKANQSKSKSGIWPTLTMIVVGSMGS